MSKFVLISTLLAATVLAACRPMTTPNPNQPAAQPSATPTLPPSGAVGEDFIGSEWRLVSYGPSAAPLTPVENTLVTLKFISETELAGSAGCNSYFGTYNLQGETFTTSGVGSTMMACGEEGVMEQESAFLQLLNEGGLLARAGDELTLTNASGTLKFERVVPPPPAALEGTLWQLESFSSNDAVMSLYAGTEITATLEDGKVAGSAGCNNYFGSYTLTGEAVQFSALGSTKMACEEEVMKQESRFLEALQGATGFVIEGQTLTLSGGAETLIFTASE